MEDAELNALIAAAAKQSKLSKTAKAKIKQKANNYLFFLMVLI